HFFVQSYSLPVPFSLYAIGAGAALLISFLAVAVVARTPQVEIGGPAGRPAALAEVPTRGTWGRALSLSMLVLCIFSGFFGTREAFRNINMTMFWVVFLLGVPYAVALFGDFYAGINPWDTLVRMIERASGRDWNGRFAYPAWLGHFPALLLYIALI